MRIAIDARMARNPLSGPGRYAINLIRALANLDNENQYIVIQNANLPEKITKAENFKTIWINHPPLSLRTVFWLQTILEKEKVQIFHSLYFLTPMGGHFTRIITIHDLMVLTFPNFFKGRSLPIKIYGKIFTNAFIRTSLACSSRIITDSETVRNQIVQWKPKCSGKISVIYPGIDSTFKRINDMSHLENNRKKFGLAKNIVLYIGNTRPYKNLPRLIKAFKLLNDDQEHKFQLVIGGGESRNLHALKVLKHNLELDDYVVFTGELTDDEVIALMNIADIFVFPSLYEGFGLPPLEAMACGTPVVTSNAGSLPEVVGDSALLVNPLCAQDIADAIQKLFLDQELKQELIRRGFERVKLFSWEKAARETLQVYTQ